jgi:calcineurin-like phosphoesterase family protein
MNTWVSTDWHKDHKNIVLPTYENRPENFDDLIVDRHNEVMAPEDILVCLGDVIFGMNKEELDKYLSRFICRKKILVRGNHDKFPTEWYLDKGFDVVCQQIVLKGILLSHHPTPLGTDHVLNVHGHFHRALHRQDESHWYPMSNRHVLLACEYTDYYPVSTGDLRNGRYTVDNVVYFRKGCKNGLEARDSFSAEASSAKS